MTKKFPSGRHVLVLFAAAGLLFLCSLSRAAEPDFFVATNGNDQWSGKLAEPKADATDGPFASFQRAQQAVRELKQAQPDRDRAIVVAIRGGTYWLQSPVSFGPDDSGSEKAPVVYQAFGDERPIFSGGCPITGWQTDQPGRWYVDLPEVKDGKWHFCQLFVGDQRRFRPRLPEQGSGPVLRRRWLHRPVSAGCSSRRSAGVVRIATCGGR